MIITSTIKTKTKKNILIKNKNKITKTEIDKPQQERNTIKTKKKETNKHKKRNEKNKKTRNSQSPQHKTRESRSCVRRTGGLAEHDRRQELDEERQKETWSSRAPHPLSLLLGSSICEGRNGVWSQYEMGYVL